MKKVFSVPAILLLCFSLPIEASASVVPLAVIQPYYEKAANASSELFISGTTATCQSSVRGSPGTILSSSSRVRRDTTHR